MSVEVAILYRKLKNSANLNSDEGLDDSLDLGGEAALDGLVGAAVHLALVLPPVQDVES